MGVKELISLLGSEIDDPDEGARDFVWRLARIMAHGMSETFLLFSQAIPSQNLGFVDPKAKTLDLTIYGRDFLIHQSPTLLTSHRDEGTTGAGKPS